MNAQAIAIERHNPITLDRHNWTDIERSLISMILSKLEETYSIDKSHMIPISMSELQAKIGQQVDLESFRKAAKRLISRVYDMEEGYEDFFMMNLIGSAIYTKGDDIVEIGVSKSVRPYLLQLKNNFTTSQLNVAWSLKSKFSKIIYDLLNEHKKLGVIEEIKVDTLKYQLGLIYPSTKKEQYKNWKIFTSKVLEVAKKDIQTHTDLSFEYYPIKTGRKVTAIKFQIIEKPIQALVANLDQSVNEDSKDSVRLTDQAEQMLMAQNRNCSNTHISSKITNFLSPTVGIWSE